MAANAHVVDGVTPTSDEVVIVSIQFEDPGSIDAWPLTEACEVGGAEGPATGLDVQVSMNRQTIVAMSPRWGAVSCLGG